MADQYFSPGQVEALIPALTEIMEMVRKAHAESSALRERLGAEQRRIAMAGGAVIDQKAWRNERDSLERLAAHVQAGLDKIQELGGVLKDVEMGLVDFPHLRQGEVVNLCWKLGERHIRFWHGLEEGYASRKPL
jgi:hypothetical protein